jgi:hypothetical protein
MIFRIFSNDYCECLIASRSSMWSVPDRVLKSERRTAQPVEHARTTTRKAAKTEKRFYGPSGARSRIVHGTS